MKRNKLIAIVMTTVLTALCAFGCGRREKINSTVVDSITVSEAEAQEETETQDETAISAMPIGDKSMTAKDLYYAYLMNTVVPQKKLAEDKFPIAAETKGEDIKNKVGAGLASAYIGDIDGDGTEEMITVALEGTTMGESAVGTLGVFGEDESAISLSVELYTMKDEKISKVSDIKGLTTIDNKDFGTMVTGVKEIDGTVYVYGYSEMRANEEETHNAIVVYRIEDGKFVKVDDLAPFASLAEGFGGMMADPDEDMYILSQIPDAWCTYVCVEAPVDGYCNISVFDQTKLKAYLYGEDPEAETETEAETENTEAEEEYVEEEYVEEYYEEEYYEE